MSNLSGIPWREIRWAFRNLRKRFFTVPRKEVPYLVVDRSVDEMVKILGQRSYAPNWEFSYRYRGEDLNLSQVVHYETDDYPDLVWWQHHVRGWETEKGLELQAHWETEPTENGKDHINEVGFNRKKGMEMLKKVLAEEGVEYKIISP